MLRCVLPSDERWKGNVMETCCGGFWFPLNFFWMVEEEEEGRQEEGGGILPLGALIVVV